MVMHLKNRGRLFKDAETGILFRFAAILSKLEKNDERKTENVVDHNTTDPFPRKTVLHSRARPLTCEKSVHSFTKKTEPDLPASCVLRVQ